MKVYYWILTVLLVVTLPSVVAAHRVNLFGYVEDGRVVLDAYFVDGTKAKGALVEVFERGTGKRLLQGRTDDNGSFSFRPPAPVDLRIVLTASMGHRAEYTITREELLGGSGVSNEGVQGGETVSEPSRREVYSLGEQEIEKVVERVVRRELGPVKSILLKIQEAHTRPSVRDVLGGVGYILGLMGVAMYFKRRK